jgi:hypothetical protein
VKFRKFFGILGWEAGTRTPIDRSRVSSRRKHLHKINDLARQNEENYGKIRNIATRENRPLFTTLRRIRCLKIH